MRIWSEDVAARMRQRGWGSEDELEAARMGQRSKDGAASLIDHDAVGDERSSKGDTDWCARGESGNAVRGTRECECLRRRTRMTTGNDNRERAKEGTVLSVDRVEIDGKSESKAKTSAGYTVRQRRSANVTFASDDFVSFAPSSYPSTGPVLHDVSLSLVPK